MTKISLPGQKNKIKHRVQWDVTEESERGALGGKSDHCLSQWCGGIAGDLILWGYPHFVAISLPNLD